MGKVAQIKGDLDDVEALLEIITILKDVSTNRFFQLAQKKDSFIKFLEEFLVYFDLLRSTDTACPLVKNDNPVTDIVLITSEASFMSQLNSRVCSAAFRETEKFRNANVVCVGWRSLDRCKYLGMNVAQVFRDIGETGRYETSLNIRDYLIERVMSGQTGRAVCVYIWAKSFNVLKPRVVTLLPASELLSVQGDVVDEDNTAAAATAEDGLSPPPAKFIQESPIDGMMKVLADVWISCRLYEILIDTQLAEAASQAQQLESSIEGLSSEKKQLMLGFKKAMRADLNKAMAEVFSATKVIRRRR